MNIDLGRDLADARLAALGENLQDADGPVHRLDTAGLRIRRFCVSAVVAHSETIRVVNNAIASNRAEMKYLQVACSAT
ncbi:hypothetical protein JCM4814A_50610 [Streptomyces phaeofaciens JCM 4814]